MGNEMSEQEEKRRLDDFKDKLPEGPDLKVNENLVRFTSLDSSDCLRQHYQRRKMEAGDCAEDWTKSLAEKLSAFSSAPELAGLGALAIAVLIDMISSSRPEESTKDALRSVFAEQKASEVRDQIDEFLKRYRMHINNKNELVSNMKWIECQLSAALTKLKNSMVRDGHMSSEALKAWVNGAAFHIHMLIHLVRLRGIQTCDPVEELLSTYKNDLDPVFEKHKEMIKGKCKKTGDTITLHMSIWYLEDEESKLHEMETHSYPFTRYNKYFEAYYDHRYSRQKCEIQQYFSDVRQNLQELVHQRGSFNID